MKPTDITPCPLPAPPIDADLRCTSCDERLFDAAAHTAEEADALSRAGRCGKWWLDTAGRALVAAVAITTNAQAATLEVSVVDAEGNPIAAAAIHAPTLHHDRARVDDGGTWRGEALPNGSEAPVALPEGVVQLQVSAPGYKNHDIAVKLRKKRVRKLTVVLQQLSLHPEFDLDAPYIVFGRDKPID